MAKRVGLVGVTGYTGMELTRILLDHPQLQLTQVTSRKEAGQPWSSWPSPTARPWRWPPNCGRRGPGWWT